MSTRKMIVATIMAVLTTMSTPAWGIHYYVDKNGDDSNGLSWATAFHTIQQGIDANDPTVVEVNEGIYYETIDFNGVSCTVTSTDPNDWNVVEATIIDANSDSNNPGRVVTFDDGEDASSILTGFTITGGYVSYPGDGAGIYCYGSSPTISSCVIYDNNAGDDGGGISCDNSSSPSISYCLITSNEADDGGGICCNNSSSPTISYCEITYNEADDKGGGIYCKANSCPTIKDCNISLNSANMGGGVYCNASDPNIEDCKVRDNYAGDDAGGIYCYNGSDPTISFCEITDNEAEDKGGGIYCKTNSNPTIKDCEISLNNAYKGGGIYCASSEPQIERCIISDNQTFADGLDENYADGGGIYCSSSNPNILNCIIRDNVSDDDAGGIYCLDGSDPNIINCTLTGNQADDKGGGIYCKTNSCATIKDCEISSNSAYKGGGIYCSASDPKIERCIVSGNQTFGGGNADGGGIYCSSSNPNILDCIIRGNVSDDDAGGIYCLDGSDPNIINCTINRNQADDKGGGIYCKTNSDAVITNCILWDDTAPTGPEIYTESSSPVVSYSNIKGDPVYPGTGNINTNPRFLDANDPAGPDGVFGTFDDGLRLQIVSPCIDAADGDAAPTTDITGRGRVDVDYVSNTGTGDPDYADIGAYESPTIWFVDEDATGNDDGSSWEDAFTDLQDALADPNDGDEIWVAEGTYKPDDVNDDRSVSFELVEGGGTYGGFAGTEIVRYQRNWAAHTTILSGDIGTPVDQNDNSYHVVKGDNNAVLDGFTITGGNANGSYPDNSGGGILCPGTSPTITNCMIADNTGNYGGGICSFFASPTISNCLITGNTASWSGGGMYNIGCYTPLTLTNCTFSGNLANWYGGGMINNNSSLIVTNSIFWGNDADVSNDEIYNHYSDPNFSYCDIEGCGGSDGWDPNFGTDLGGNIDSDPCFVDINDPAGPDGIFGTFDDGLRLMGSSPCIDAADGDTAPSEDILGIERVDVNDVNNTGTGDPNYADMGAYEYADVYNITKDKYYYSIQSAINDANDGDTIVISPRTYYETIDFNGKAVTLTSTAPNNPNIVSSTIIDANDKSSSSYVVTFDSGEDSNSILDGITITGGYYGIYCMSSSSPTITNCMIANNKYGCYVAYYCSPKITNCRITDNLSWGVYTESSSPEITNCTISDNGSIGLRCYYWSPIVSNCTINSNGSYGVSLEKCSVPLTNCVIAKNYSYGVSLDNSSGSTIINCTIVGNTSYGICGNCEEVTNCIIWDNGDDLYNCNATYSCIEDQDSGLGNIHANPMFVSAETNDFHLWYSSACIDAGDPCSDYSNEPNDGGDRINMGAYGNTSEAAVIIDEDSDGLSDEWELCYWPGSDLNDVDPNADPDGDGLRNKDEYHVHWHPNDVNSYDGIVRNDRVDVNYPSIDWAVLLAFNDDTLVMDPNTFYEKVDFNNKPICLRSTDPNDANVVATTIIDANDISSSSYVVTFKSGEDSNSILDGITITGGYHGIVCKSSSSPKITNCRITDNFSWGVYTESSSPEITNCTISDNGSFGLRCYYYGSPIVSNCTINSNGSHGVSLEKCSVPLTNCVIAKNSSYGVSLDNSSGSTIINCTIVSNNSYGIRCVSGSCEMVKNCIVWDNGNDLDNCESTYSCIEDDDPGLGNFSINPRFVDTDANDFHLKNWSRCIDWGDPNSDYSNEPNGGGGRINVGAYGNTEEAETLVDEDSDGLPDGWQEFYWPGYDPNDPNYGPGGNPDVDDFNNLVEYLFGYDPNVFTDADMKLIVGLSDTRFDPTEGEKLTIIYLLNMGANTVITFTNTDTSETVRTISRTVAAGQIEEDWDGEDDTGEIVEDDFYDIVLDANDDDGNTANYGPVTVEVYYIHDIDNLKCNPYRILPMNNEVSKITYDLTTDANMVVTIYDPNSVLFATLVDDELQTEGSQELIWYGRDKDPNDPNSMYISKEGAYLVRVKFVGMREKQEETVTAYK